MMRSYSPRYADFWPRVRETIAASWPRTLATYPGLPKPFTASIPGTDMMFYWDTYFTHVGLLQEPDGQQLARDNIDNLLAQVETRGFIPNANHPWGVNRSQTPFLAQMVRDYYQQTPERDLHWLAAAFATLRKEYAFWTDSLPQIIEEHTTPIPHLYRFSHHATPEELLSFYTDILVPRLFLPADISDAEKIRSASPYLAEGETGWDFTPRFEERCSDFAGLDLNVNLCLYEEIFQWLAAETNSPVDPLWQERFEQRKKLIQTLFWDEKRGLFADYDFVNRRPSRVASTITFCPLWAGLATEEQARRVRDNVALFEGDFGLSACEPTERPQRYQWDHPALWPPLTWWAVSGLRRYGYETDALRLAMKYLDVVAKNFVQPDPAGDVQTRFPGQRVPGKVWEKFTVDGRINDFEYIADTQQGWSAGVFIALHEWVKARLDRPQH
ncbi:trehalase [candidate division KSB1 bacterium]|nr:trehalase [candidate division KSB1 bacterium]